MTWEEHSEDPVSSTAQPRTNEVFIKMFDLQATMYSDQTGAFPCSSSRGYRYLMVFYDEDTNAILFFPLKTKKSAELTSNIVTIVNNLTKRGFKPRYWILDNECSGDMKTTFNHLNIAFQLVPAGIHI